MSYAEVQEIDSHALVRPYTLLFDYCPAVFVLIVLCCNTVAMDVVKGSSERQCSSCM